MQHTVQMPSRRKLNAPLQDPCQVLFCRYMLLFSITASEIASLSFSRFNSLNACLKFRSTGSCTWLLLSQVLNLSMVLFIEAVSGLPEASLLTGLMIVAKPISCMVSDVGAPALVLSPCSSWVNDLHSGPDSCSFFSNYKAAL